MADADEVVAVESKATVEVQAEAEKMGWIPPKRFRGDPTRFVDADLYIERGETVLPIVKEQNKRLHTEVEELRTRTEAQATALKTAQDAIEQIEERHSVDKQRAVESARKQLRAELAAASEAGDHTGVAELTDQLTQLNKAEEKAPAAEKKEEAKPYVVPPDLKAWNEENPWYGTNKRKTALALGIAQELRDAGDTTTGRAFFEKVAVEVEKELGGKREETRVDKVEGGRNGSDGDARSGVRGRKDYASLPSDAKAACDADIKKFVGAGKKYPDAAAYRAGWSQIYFGMES